MAEKPRFPNSTNRTVVIGRTGTGKTVSGLHILSTQDLTRPWVVLNFKNDDHIDDIPFTQETGFDHVPEKDERGLYILRPLPSDMQRPAPGKPSNLETYLWKIWDRGNCGIFCDETFMVGNNDAFDACLTQGRSKRVPMIMCTQRPVWITRFAFSEASFIQCFDLNQDDDISKVESFMPLVWDDEMPLEKYQSWWYEIDSNNLFRFKPCPPMEDILKTFAAKLEPLQKRYQRI